MWFKRRDMGYEKSLKKFGHMKVQVQKNDDYMKAHEKRRKRDSYVSK
jgi:hypothetical protein